MGCIWGLVLLLLLIIDFISTVLLVTLFKIALLVTLSVAIKQNQNA